jgi:hypothetical protein
MKEWVLFIIKNKKDMNKIKMLLLLMVFCTCLQVDLIARNPEKKTLLDSLILTRQDKALKLSYSTYKKACLNVSSADSSLIELREDFIEKFNDIIIKDSLYTDQELLRNIEDDLNTIFIRVACLEGNCLRVCRIELSEIWKRKCHCPATTIYSDILALIDETSDREYPFYYLKTYFEFMSKADLFLKSYPKHKYTKQVQNIYNDYLQILSDAHLVLIKKEEEDTSKLYIFQGLDAGEWPNKFDADKYKELLEEYPGSYSSILHSCIYDISTFIYGQDIIFVYIKKLPSDDSGLSTDFQPFHCCISFENKEFEGYSILKFHYNKNELHKISKSLSGGEIYKAAIVNDHLVRIIKD